MLYFFNAPLTLWLECVFTTDWQEVDVRWPTQSGLDLFTLAAKTLKTLQRISRSHEEMSFIPLSDLKIGTKTHHGFGLWSFRWHRRGAGSTALLTGNESAGLWAQLICLRLLGPDKLRWLQLHLVQTFPFAKLTLLSAELQTSSFPEMFFLTNWTSLLAM